MPELDRRVAPVVEALRDLIATRRRSLASLERGMGYSEKYLSKLFNGSVELKLVHLFDLLAELDVEPRDFFCRLCGHSGLPSDDDVRRRLDALEEALRRQRT